MKYRLTIAELAEFQTDDYEIDYNSKFPGLGDRFIDHLFDTYQKIESGPKSYQKIQGEIRRALVNGFPYSVFYEIMKDEVVVLSVLPQASDPGRWPS